ncbi:hypothetical protein XA68_16970 [Ophiocordyceps unilateralis]|uniref:Uncharacterized protein n=1 Tax=Ophiocordyceps unilateralis TaxID=268505 RepID=A0A2A9P4Q2_OPHUN|nr:hypothetical protein XA68_16970 [Ophiocordyceps unilateralis]
MTVTQNAPTDHRHDHRDETKQPSSPTLTNPDMILPEDHFSPARTMTRNEAPLLNPAAFYRAMPLGPSTPIIYGNGTMLSDIGEVTEVESIAGSSPPRRFSSRRCSGAAYPLRSSPTIGKGGHMRRRSAAHDAVNSHRLSVDSTGTVIESDRIAASADFFDDCISIGDSSFQGDDEGSMASSYADDWAHHPRDSDARVPSHSADHHRYSTSSISRRAEQILANAKRRLTTMEGNLNKARTLGYSSASDGSTPSPSGRPPSDPDEDAFSTPTTHSRNASDSRLPASANPAPRAQRSASAVGALGGYRRSLSASMSADALDGRCRRTNKLLSYHPLDTTLKPLEGDAKENGGKETSRASSVASPDLSSCTDNEMPRSSVSTMHVRDLQDQMQGLKNKISSLRDQARADSMRRRSLQGLRTPSPFTHAGWDRGSTEPLDQTGDDPRSPSCVSPRGGTVLVLDAPAIQPSENLAPLDSPSDAASFHEVRETPDDGGCGGIEHVEFVDDIEDAEAVETIETVEWQSESQEGFDDAHREGPDAAEDDEMDDVDYDEADDDDQGNAYECSESGDSTYHDSTPHAISHEDREDAFDYERFFLHSAMGTISRQEWSRRGSVSSADSETSIETTRGPVLSVARRASLDTFTTVDSFATAAEGHSSRDSLALEEDRTDGFVTPSLGYDDGDVDRASSRGSAIFSSSSDGSMGWQNGRGRRATVNAGSTERAQSFHRPSFSSFESTGTNRSFPLVNRVRISGGMVTPVGSPEHELKQVADTLMSETASICDKESLNGGTQSPAMQMLSKTDQMMVERVVASLGRCVLGLTEAARTGPASGDEFRRRIDAARRVLEAGK